MTTKVTDLNEATSLADGDLFMVVVNPGNANTVETQKIAVNTLSATLLTSFTANVITSNTVTANVITSNTVTANVITSNTVTANVITSNTVTANVIAANKTRFREQTTPISSSEVSTGVSPIQGDMFYDDNYIYIAVSNTSIKRISLSNFT